MKYTQVGTVASIGQFWHSHRTLGTLKADAGFPSKHCSILSTELSERYRPAELPAQNEKHEIPVAWAVWRPNSLFLYFQRAMTLNIFLVS